MKKLRSPRLAGAEWEGPEFHRGEGLRERDGSLWLQAACPVDSLFVLDRRGGATLGAVLGGAGTGGGSGSAWSSGTAGELLSDSLGPGPWGVHGEGPEGSPQLGGTGEDEELEGGQAPCLQGCRASSATGLGGLATQAWGSLEGSGEGAVALGQRESC